MPESKLKPGALSESGGHKPAMGSPEKTDSIVEGAVLEVAGKVDVLKGNEEEGGAFSEKEKKQRDSTSAGGAAGATVKVASQDQALPPVEEMIKQTVVAITAQLNIEKQEMQALRRNGKTQPVVFNEKVKQMRLLSAVLWQLKYVKNQATEFVTSLWRKYVAKTG